MVPSVDHLHRLLDEAMDRFSAGIEGDVRVRGIVAEIATALGQESLLIDALTEMTRVPNCYRRDELTSVRTELTYDPSKGWNFNRDDAGGGGPWRTGPSARTPSEAIAAFNLARK